MPTQKLVQAHTKYQGGQWEHQKMQAGVNGICKMWDWVYVWHQKWNQIKLFSEWNDTFANPLKKTGPLDFKNSYSHKMRVIKN